MLVRRGAAFAAAALLLIPASAAAEDTARLKKSLNSAMGRASSQSGAFVFDLADRKALYSRKATSRRILASNTKLFTTGAALDTFGAEGTFSTDVLADRLPGSRGVVRGNVYLRGGGDPSFGSSTFTERAYGGGGATVEALARQVERAGVKRITGRVLGDESLFDSLRGGPDSGFGTSVWVGPLSALSYNRGLAHEQGSAFQRNPPEFAAKQFAAALKRRGIKIGGKAGVARAKGRSAPLASAQSLQMARILRLTNKISDNFFAEMLAKQLDAGPGHRGTTTGGARAAAQFAQRFGSKPRLVDGSGLSRSNMAAPRAVVKYLRGMRRHEDFSAFYDSLPVAGQYGTLQERHVNKRCRAKTGTISGVSALSGYCRGVSGDLIAFSILMNGVGYNYEHARDLQDTMTQAIARYG